MITINRNIRPYSIRSLLHWNGFEKHVEILGTAKWKYVHWTKDIGDKHIYIGYTSQMLSIHVNKELILSVIPYSIGNAVPCHEDVYKEFLYWLMTNQDILGDVNIPDFTKTKRHG